MLHPADQDLIVRCWTVDSHALTRDEHWRLLQLYASDERCRDLASLFSEDRQQRITDERYKPPYTGSKLNSCPHKLFPEEQDLVLHYLNGNTEFSWKELSELELFFSHEKRRVELLRQLSEDRRSYIAEWGRQSYIEAEMRSEGAEWLSEMGVTNQ